jgi:2-methylisocitrate lyase-like PEP mutase family enzyme
MTTQYTALAERATALRALHSGQRPLVLPNAWDVASARLVVKAGFPVVATSSGAIAATLGHQDDDSMPIGEAFGVVARIARNVPVPVTADLEAGYGVPPAELVNRLLDAGAVGCNLEDTDHHGGGGLIDADAHVERLGAIRQAANDAGVDIVLNARSTSCASTGIGASSSKRRCDAPNAISRPVAIAYFRSDSPMKS